MAITSSKNRDNDLVNNSRWWPVDHAYQRYPDVSGRYQRKTTHGRQIKRSRRLNPTASNDL